MKDLEGVIFLFGDWLCDWMCVCFLCCLVSIVVIILSCISSLCSVCGLCVVCVRLFAWEHFVVTMLCDSFTHGVTFLLKPPDAF